ncbi:kelch repeat-containing protein [uncultured Pseudomonas sp.]|uniref:Kelch repeat-containing protein n=1 Tax=uncultured Pseudomonas sp. TaxID=114707 RepID=UPI0026015002|nr:kelch repeat-containing protein [uncultured Pseudomonas sp.]
MSGSAATVTPGTVPWSRREVLLGAAVLGGSALLAGLPGAVRAQAGPRWRRAADLPWAVQEVYGVNRAGRAVIVGGMVVRDGRSQATAQVAVYDPVQDAWQAAAPLPTPRHHPAVAVVDDQLFAIGGARHGLPGEPAGEHWRQQTDVFIERAGTWQHGPALPLAQSEGVALVHAGRIHLITGRTPLSPSATRWSEQRDTAFHQVLDVAQGSWSFAAPAPAARNSAGGGVINGYLYLVGGRTMDGGNLARLDRYDPQHDRWETLRPLPVPAGGLATAVAGGQLYAFGGERLEAKGPEGVIAHSWRYDPALDHWEALPHLPTPRHGLAAVALDDRILLIGGGALPATGRTTAVTEALML